MNLNQPFNKSIGQAACEAASLDFKWQHFQAEIILLNVRWYLRYPLSYRNLAEMMAERGLKVDHTTIYRWVMAYSPEINKRYFRNFWSANRTISGYESINMIRKGQVQNVE